MKGISYRGYDSGHSGGQVVVVEHDGEVVGSLPHIVKHSPDGFAWGYAGSGPAELARCLLIAALDLRPDCAKCGGQGCIWCDQGYTLHPAMYQQFKFDRIANLLQHQGWEISRDEIRTWVAAHRAATESTT